MKPFAIIALPLFALWILGGCAPNPSTLTSSLNAQEGTSPELVSEDGSSPVTAPSGAFLASGHSELETWMDQRFKIRYEYMPLEMVFKQEPIQTIKYQKINLPPNPPLFKLISPSISRREILREIATFYGLTMEVVMDNGLPSHVLVQGAPDGTIPPTSLEASLPNEEVEEAPTLGPESISPSIPSYGP